MKFTEIFLSSDIVIEKVKESYVNKYGEKSERVLGVKINGVKTEKDKFAIVDKLKSLADLGPKIYKKKISEDEATDIAETKSMSHFLSKNPSVTSSSLPMTTVSDKSLQRTDRFNELMSSRFGKVYRS